MAQQLKAKAGKEILRALGQAMLRGPSAQALHLLKTGGSAFLKAAALADNSNGAVNGLVVGLLRTKDGRDWLRDNQHEVRTWVQRADQQAKASVAKALQSHFKSKSEERRYAAEFLSNQWDIRLT